MVCQGNNRQIVLSILVTIFFFAFPLLAQVESQISNPTSRYGCQVIDPHSPSLSLTYKRLDNSRKEVWLHLRNNTSYGILIETDGINPRSEEYAPYFSVKTNKRSDGVTEIHYSLKAIREGVPLPVFYDFINWQQRRGPEPANYWEHRHIRELWVIPPGGSILFKVKGDYFKKDYSISVPFAYEWEQKDRETSIDHRVAFAASELPEDVLAMIKRKK
jgi:hypothetical protein